MEKKSMKKMLAGLSIAGLLAGVSGMPGPAIGASG